MLHQWHPRKDAVLTNGEEIEQAKEAWIRNHKLVQARSSSLQRNPNGWGQVS